MLHILLYTLSNLIKFDQFDRVLVAIADWFNQLSIVDWLNYVALFPKDFYLILWDVKSFLKTCIPVNLCLF